MSQLSGFKGGESLPSIRLSLVYTYSISSAVSPGAVVPLSRSQIIHGLVTLTTVSTTPTRLGYLASSKAVGTPSSIDLAGTDFTVTLSPILNFLIFLDILLEVAIANDFLVVITNPPTLPSFEVLTSIATSTTPS